MQTTRETDMPRDLGKYLHRLDEHDDLSPSQKLVVAQAVWSIIEQLCDCAMHTDATQLALGITEPIDSNSPSDPVELESTTKPTVRRAAEKSAHEEHP